jgi:hypothetical protein
MINTQNNSTIDTTINTTTNSTEILTEIINSKKFGKTFVPEVDGKIIMMQMLPIEQAKAEGKGSPLYQEVLSTIHTVTEYLLMMQNGITPQIPVHESNRRHCGPCSDTVRRSEQRPYQGVYGNYSLKR